MYSNVFLKKEENNEEQQEIYLDLILISAILSSGDLFFCTHPDLMEVQQICSQKLIEKFRGENIDELIKRGKITNTIYLLLSDNIIILFKYNSINII